MNRASVPGKIILFGEHAVVYDRPALAVPVTQVKVDVEVRESSTSGIHIHAPNIALQTELAQLDAQHPLRLLIGKIEQTSGQKIPPCDISIQSSIPVASGLGSGAAVSVALARALSAFIRQSFTDEQVNDLAFEIEKRHHGTPSGIDNTVITYARPVYFVKGQPLEFLNVGQPFSVVIADTGIPAPTKQSVGDVRARWLVDQTRWELVFEAITEITRQARVALESGNWRELGPLMNANHALLQEMTVSSPELDRLVKSARGAGALGAKLSGGGRGGNMIALVEKEKAPVVTEALLLAGAKQAFATVVS